MRAEFGCLPPGAVGTWQQVEQPAALLVSARDGCAAHPRQRRTHSLSPSSREIRLPRDERGSSEGNGLCGGALCALSDDVRRRIGLAFQHHTKQLVPREALRLGPLSAPRHRPNRAPTAAVTVRDHAPDAEASQSSQILRLLLTACRYVGDATGPSFAAWSISIE